MAGLVMLLLTAACGFWFGWQPLTIGGFATASLILTAIWEWLSLHGGWQRFAPWMGPLFSRGRAG